MSLIDYYKTQFQSDIKALVPAKGRRELSVYYLLPCEQTCMSKITWPEKFLTCLFFEVLSDQAVHYKFREQHCLYNLEYSPVKLMGFLATCGHHMPPRHALILSVLYAPRDSKLIDDLPGFCRVVMTDCITRFENWASMANLEIKTTVVSVLNAMHGEIALDALTAFGNKDSQGDFFSYKYSLHSFGNHSEIIRNEIYKYINSVV